MRKSIILSFAMLGVCLAMLGSCKKPNHSDNIVFDKWVIVDNDDGSKTLEYASYKADTGPVSGDERYEASSMLQIRYNGACPMVDILFFNDKIPYDQPLKPNTLHILIDKSKEMWYKFVNLEYKAGEKHLHLYLNKEQSLVFIRYLNEGCSFNAKTKKHETFYFFTAPEHTFRQLSPIALDGFEGAFDKFMKECSQLQYDEYTGKWKKAQPGQ